MSTKVQKIYSKNYRRRIVTDRECQLDLKHVLPKLFSAFEQAHQLFEKEIRNTPPLSRDRVLEASLLNSKMIQCIQQEFPDNWKFGKYKRFTLRIGGYTILFKKLNRNGMPMNIKTRHSEAIVNQLSLSLFDGQSHVFEPILFFGYSKDKFGVISKPKLTYIDEDRVKWTITGDTVEIPVQENEKLEPVLPKLKGRSLKKASNS